MIYLDNAATTPMLPEVVEVMRQSMLKNYGNPSSTHQIGRKAKAAIETARKNIATQFSVSASEIIFTSSGTEADNLALQNAVINLAVKRIVTAKTEHYAVLNTINYLQKTYNIVVEYVKLDEFGAISITHLEELLATNNTKTMVSLMWVNNETGNILPVEQVATLCKKYQALFHSDTVQAIGYYPINLQKIPIDFITASAHKFHGSKGVGFLYIKKGLQVKPIIHGGNQEKGIRSSTENVHAILGMEKALQIKMENLSQDQEHLKQIKTYCIEQLTKLNCNIRFNGNSNHLKKSSHKILNIRLPIKKEMLLFYLDLAGLAVSGGSACQSGANKGSHVLQAFLNNTEKQKTSLRLSFSKFTTKKDIDFAVEKIKNAIQN